MLLTFFPTGNYHKISSPETFCTVTLIMDQLLRQIKALSAPK